ncbi:MAG: hypothetical protein AAFN30_11000, partial [Actinomycetota bacterium]
RGGLGGPFRFVPLARPVLVGGDTDAAFNHSVALDIGRAPGLGSARDRDQTAALVVDVALSTETASTLTVHAGDRPQAALVFAVPASGRLRVPHLIVVPDEQGRIVLSTDGPAEVAVVGVGRYEAAERARAGRFVPVDARRIGSLVPTIEGGRLSVALPAALGPDWRHVGRAVVRLTADVGPNGALAVDDGGRPTLWPAPETGAPTIGSALLVVEPGVAGTVGFDFVGGSVLALDLVGYYTNDSAPSSDRGLLLLPAQPEPWPVGGRAHTDAAPGEAPASARLAVVTLEAPDPTEPAPQAGPADQESGRFHVTTAWLEHSPGPAAAVEAGGSPDHTGRAWVTGVLT